MAPVHAEPTANVNACAVNDTDQGGPKLVAQLRGLLPSFTNFVAPAPAPGGTPSNPDSFRAQWSSPEGLWKVTFPGRSFTNPTLVLFGGVPREVVPDVVVHGPSGTWSFAAKDAAKNIETFLRNLGALPPPPEPPRITYSFDVGYDLYRTPPHWATSNPNWLSSLMVDRPSSRRSDHLHMHRPEPAAPTPSSAERDHAMQQVRDAEQKVRTAQLRLADQQLQLRIAEVAAKYEAELRSRSYLHNGTSVVARSAAARFAAEQTVKLSADQKPAGKA